ncbi:S9 family peptidase [Candidatus Tisiphia endosymbiont of Beris chalybata]|uniref:S9 family peptidase n=1 Tax=Candidatus Tisiphia endosymbiont of Beris chalybata TaxID=3066262 RepID=UPI00312CAAD9
MNQLNKLITLIILLMSTFMSTSPAFSSSPILNGLQELDFIVSGERAERTTKYVSTRNHDKMKKQLLKGEEYPLLIPRKVLFGNPDKLAVQFSHDGKYLSYLAPKDGIVNIWVATVGNLKEAIAITNEKERPINNYFWAYNNKDILYLYDEKGDENYRLYKCNIDTKKTELLTPKTAVKAQLIGTSINYPNEILIGLNDRDKRYFDVYKLNLITLQKELIFKNDSFFNIVADNNLQIRVVSSPTQEGGADYYQLKENKLEHFMTVAMEDMVVIVNFDQTNNNIYLLDNRNSNTMVLKLHNLLTGQEEIIAKNDLVDLAIGTRHPMNRTIQTVRVNYDKISEQILDKTIEKDIKYLTNFHKGNLYITSRTLDDSMWIVAYQSDTVPLKYYQYNRHSTKAEPLFTSRPDLAQYNLLSMHPVIIKSRDGLDLVSYLTFAAGTTLDSANKPSHKSPLIIYVHGGPHARDEWGSNIVHQWLANRGYSVLSINYRGSTGFGKDFINAANLEWGNKMHHDLIDGVNWALANNITDKDKIAIMGGSYGGYATLVGLTMTPEVFACGVDLVGPSNLLTLINSVPPYWEPALNRLKKTIGPWDTEEEKEFLHQRSPLTFAANITKPLFIAQGANDPRVKQAESDQIVNVMNQANIPVIYALYEDEGHGFARPENRLSYYALVEHFLGRILGGQVEDIGDDLQGANLILNKQKMLNKETVKSILDQMIR